MNPWTALAAIAAVAVSAVSIIFLVVTGRRKSVKCIDCAGPMAPGDGPFQCAKCRNEGWW